MQVYVLSILTTVVAGIALAFERMDERLRIRAVFNPELFHHAGFRLGLGVTTFVVGFLKLLLPVGTTPVVGDLVPALAGLTTGFALAFQYYQSRVEMRTQTVESIDSMVNRFGASVGVISMLAGIAHLILPNALFL